MSTDIRTYGNWQAPRSAGLLGLGRAGTWVLIIGLFTALVTTIISNLIYGGLAFTVFAVILGALMYRDVHNRAVLTRVSERTAYRSARRNRQHLLRNGPLGRTDHGSCRLPGLLAATRLLEGRDSLDRPFALVHMPSTGDYTLVITADPDGVSLVDRPQVDSWVADYGFYLRSLSDQPDVLAAQVTIETAPDTGDRLRREVSTSIDPASPAFSRDVMQAICQEYPEGSATVRAYATITMSAATRKGGRKRRPEEMLRDVAAKLPDHTGRLVAAGAAAARPVSAEQLTDLVRIAYDPAVAAAIDDARTATGSSGLRWEDAGPSGAQADWDSYRHDGATSISWQMTLPPQGTVQSDILNGFLAPDARVDRKRITLLYRPVPVADSARIVHDDARNARFALGSSGKGTPTARDYRRLQLAERAATEEAGGASLVNFGIVATATVLGNDRDRIDDARAAVETSSAAARLQMRIVTGAQDAAFAAALPLGVITTKHLTLPTEFRK